MTNQTRPIGRPRRYSEIEELFNATKPKSMARRPLYRSGIGFFRGKRCDTVWVKFKLPHGGYLNNKHYAPNDYAELKVGYKSSYSWADLEDILKEYQSKADRNELVREVIIPTFEEYALEWLEIMKPCFARGCYQKTGNVIRKDLLPYFGQMKLDCISVDDVLKWRSKLRASLKASTVKRYENDLKAILNAAIRSEYLTDNPVQKARPIRVEDVQIRYATPEELKALIKGAPEIRDWLQDYILWAVITGMRKGEIRNINWSNIHDLHGDNPYVTLVTGKTFKTRRVYLTGELVKVLHRQKARETSDASRVFPYADCTVRRAWDQLRDLTEIHDITVQNLRATSSTYAARSGEVSVRSIASRNGHTLDVMERHYAGSMESESARVSRVIEMEVCKAITI